MAAILGFPGLPGGRKIARKLSAMAIPLRGKIKDPTLAFSLAVTGAAIQFRRRYTYLSCPRDCVFCKNVLQ
jgi:hypothetical protein